MPNKVLRNLVEEDIIKVLNNEKVNDKNFFWIIIHYLLDNDKINLEEIDDISKQLSMEYKQFLDAFDQELVDANGEIISVLKNGVRKFFYRMKPILDKLDKMKKNDNDKYQFN